MLEPLQLGGELDFSLLDFPSHRELAACSEALNAFYLEHPALYEGDGDTEGFTFLNCHSYEENVVVFLRRAASEDLLVAVNFSGTSYPRFNLGVPYAGSYKEIFTTDEERFGGSGLLNPRALPARAMEVDDKELARIQCALLCLQEAGAGEESDAACGNGKERGNQGKAEARESS